MENKTQLAASSSSNSKSTTTSSFDHLFGPKDSTSSSSSTGTFSTIFPSPSTVLGRDSSHSSGNMGSQRIHGMSHNENKKYDSQDSKGNGSGKELYQVETVEPSYLSSSIYYGGQENYSPRTMDNSDQSHHNHTIKKDGKDDDPNNGSHSNTGGNWWQGSFYY